MGVRVLLIEDDATIAEPLAEGLKSFGLTVHHVSTGAAGLRGPYGDVVLLDLGLPDMDGIDVCRGIRQVSDVPVIILSARGEEADRVLGLELGADDYLAKPFSIRELVARVRAVTRRTQRRRQGAELMGGSTGQFPGVRLPGEGADRPADGSPGANGALEAGVFGAEALVVEAFGPGRDGSRGQTPADRADGTDGAGRSYGSVPSYGSPEAYAAGRTYGSGSAPGSGASSGSGTSYGSGASSGSGTTDASGTSYGSGEPFGSGRSYGSGGTDAGYAGTRPPGGSREFGGSGDTGGSRDFGGSPEFAATQAYDTPRPAETTTSFDITQSFDTPRSLDTPRSSGGVPPSASAGSRQSRAARRRAADAQRAQDSSRSHDPARAFDEAYEAAQAYRPSSEPSHPSHPSHSSHPTATSGPFEANPAGATADGGGGGPQAGPLVVDRRTRQVWVGDSPVSLTPKEFELIALLTEDPGAVYSRQQILDRVWDPNYEGPTKTLDVHIATLRRKLGNPAWIQTLRGVGFRLAVQSRPPSAGGSHGASYGGAHGDPYGGAHGASYGEPPGTGRDDLGGGPYAAPGRPAAYR